jgi:Flp pilus assembly protein TadD
MKKRLSKSALLIILVALIVSTLLGCSRLKSTVAEPVDNNMSKQGTAITPDSLAGFVSSVRPYQESVDSILRRARYFQENRKFRLAIQEFRAAVDIDPNNVQAYNSMGVCYDTLGDYERAAYCYTKALALNHDLAYIQNNLGYSYLLKGNLDAAIEAFKKAIDLGPQKALYHNNLGLAYAQKGLFQPAFEEFSVAGGETKAHYNLAQILNRSGLDVEAVLHLAQAESGIKPPATNDSVIADSVDSTKPDPYRPAESLSDSARASNEQKTPAPDPAISQTHELPEKTTSEGVPPSEMGHGHFTVQVASCRSVANADNLRQSIEALGYPGVILEEDGPDKWYVVRVGPFNELTRADSAARVLSQVNGGQPVLVKGTKELGGATPHGEFKKEVRISYLKSGDKDANGDEPGVEVSNGNGIRFMARDVSRYLAKRGSKVQKLTNAENFSHEKTIIYYCDGYFAHAYRIAEELPGSKKLEKVQRLKTQDIKIRLLIGKDLAPFRETFDDARSTIGAG